MGGVIKDQAAIKKDPWHYTKIVLIQSNDELGTLADHFNQMTVGLQERYRLRRSLDLAKEVQQNLLPKTDPVVAGLDIAGKSIYCDETGGDYFDYLDSRELGGQKFAALIGDVSGHGIPSALLMATARAFIRPHRPWIGQHCRSGIRRQSAADKRRRRNRPLYDPVLSADRSSRWQPAMGSRRPRSGPLL